MTMAIGGQTFDHLAVHSGGEDARVLPLDKLFDGLAAQLSASGMLVGRRASALHHDP